MLDQIEKSTGIPCPHTDSKVLDSRQRYDSGEPVRVRYRECRTCGKHFRTAQLKKEDERICPPVLVFSKNGRA